MRFFACTIPAIFLVASCNNGSGSDDPPNTAPLINAGADQTANENAPVMLSATLTDAEGDTSVAWTQISGPTIPLNDSTSLTPGFMAPIVSSDIELVFRVTANDGEFTATDDITVTIQNLATGGGSPQGIPNTANDRRNRDRANRNGNPPVVDLREVRTYDGSNNNAANPNWGATFIHLQRFAASDYADGISSLAGPLRPSPREISNVVMNQDDGVSIPNEYSGSDFVWQWGQFIDHDIDLTDGNQETENIEVPLGDIWFDPNNIGSQIIPFTRALFDSATGTDSSNPREQENEITSWIDGSMVYGSDDERAKAIREDGSPFLKTSAGNLLPFNADSLTNANGFVTDPTTLFLAGDVRANEQIGLTVMHTLFMREHNRLAERIADGNPTLSDEAVFEQTRRLVIAKIQKITFEEWLPALLGPDAIPVYSGYDDSVNPSIFNEFSVAAFRLGHSMINQFLLRVDETGTEITDGHLSLADSFFTAPSVLTNEDSLDPILRGLSKQTHQKIDAKIIHDLRNFLFGAPGLGGLDLASLNIQRGRDHGIPSYNEVRAALGLARVTSFADITSDTDMQNALFDAYGGVDDVDMWVGGLAEDAFGNSQLGELFHTILVRQFTALRDGDRFWYQNDLTPDELDRLRGTSLTRVIRDNTGVGMEIPENAFIVSDSDWPQAQ